MSDQITLTGIIGTVPRRSTAKNGSVMTSFRLASRQRHYDRSTSEWVDDESSWYTVRTYRQLAVNAAQSLSNGERVIVTGRLTIRNWTNGDRSGIEVEIVADAVGHDLTFYTTTPVRRGAPARTSSEPPEPSEPSGTEPAESFESALAAGPDTTTLRRSGDGFVPSDTDTDGESGTDTDRNVFARLDS
jgi:single-strand DNA-binding protein